MNTTHHTKDFTSKDALQRCKSIPWAVLVAPSGTGKSSLIAAILGEEHGEKLGSILKGENAQTTKISTLFILDSRIKDTKHFSIKVRLKQLNKKLVYEQIVKEVYKIFSDSDYTALETIETMDGEFVRNIVKPQNALYDLSLLKSFLDLEELIMILTPMLKLIEQYEGKTFNEIAKERKKNLNSKYVKLATVREALFYDLWDEYSKKTVDMSPLDKWIDRIGYSIEKTLVDLFDCKPDSKNELHLINESLDDKFHVLKALFDKSAPYNLIIEEIYYACKPHTSLVEAHNKNENKYPFRFAFRDTMGFTQSGTTEEEMEEALSIALNFDTDSVLILLNLNEREDNLNIYIQRIQSKIKSYKKVNNLKKPVNILFTKADVVIEQKVNVKKSKLSITQDDFSMYAPEAIEEIEKEIKDKGSKLQDDLTKIDWLSLFYKDSKIDPIQLALKDEDLLCGKFQPEGLYEYIFKLAKEGQESLLPFGQSKALIVSPHNYGQTIIPINVKLEVEIIHAALKLVQQSLLNDENKKVYYDNIVKNKFLFHGNAVATYWAKLSIGIGHKTRAAVYANFQLNMKLLIKSIIHSDALKGIILENINIGFDNLPDDDLLNVVRYFGGQDLENLERSVLEEQLSNSIRAHLANHTIYNEVIDRVAYNVSYGNQLVKELLTTAYLKHPSYDLSLRNVQQSYYNLFRSDNFRDILADEFGNELSTLLNKLFVAI